MPHRRASSLLGSRGTRGKRKRRVRDANQRAETVRPHEAGSIATTQPDLLGGAVIATALGALATFPLVARVLFPRLAARLRTSAGLWVVTKDTRLRLRRETADASSAADGIGLAVEEMATCAESLLREIGLISNFAPLVVISGHCSSSLNNPHKSAYDCGACGGGSGGPNARAVAQILNQPDVRAKLKERGIEIPAGTRFVGAVHNTCIDSVTMFDLDLLPESHAELLQQLRLALDEACRRNAHERARRFLSADLQLTFEEALRHAEARSEDLAQARPEYGHCTVACCIVGRRSRTRGLFMDRRAFLASYDPEQDDEEFSVLTRVMTPIVPVCGGINLQYFFSHIDSRNWGSGSKLPHNITGMLGVMDGTLSDLRHGLPWQAVEIHEPLRLTIVIETPLSSMATLFSKLPTLENVARNGWVYLAVLDPGSDQIWHYHGGKFEPYLAESQLIPRASSSWEWYHGWREPLPFAMID
ncbi:MAG: putative inorganic carbon transporter subunit DabA [Planctomycetaceae bacterium]